MTVPTINPSTTNTKEVWRPIPSCNGYYEASSFGQIRRARTYRCTWAGKIMVPRSGSNGYPMLSLSMGGKVRVCSVHTLIAEAFLGPRPMEMSVNHLNSVRHDNRAENLEYTTARGNTHHAMKLGRLAHGEKHGCAKLKDEEVKRVKALLKEGMPQTEIAKIFLVSKYTINLIHKRKTWKHID